MRLKLALIVLFSSITFAQPVSIGIRGGVPLTGSFTDVTSTFGSDSERLHSPDHKYIVGAMVELHLPLGFSVEADALYHPLELTQDITVASVLSTNSTTYTSFEFPILAKYHFLPLPVIKPFVEAGPSFRAPASAVSGYLSKSGFAFGGGVELKASRLRLEPELRYIRWGADKVSVSGSSLVTNLAPSNVNQVEFLVGLSF